MSDDTETAAPEPAPDHHRHAGAKPPLDRRVVALAVVGGVLLLVIIGLLAWLIVSSNATPGPTPSPTSSSATPSPTPTPTQTTTPTVAACTTATSTAALGTPDGTAGSTHVPIIFTNSSTEPCTLEGFPAVVFVGDGDGTQLGAPATEDTATSPVAVVTIEPGNSAMSLLTITTADVEGCTRVAADGFRVTPPGSADGFFIATTDYEACDSADVSVLTVSAVATN